MSVLERMMSPMAWKAKLGFMSDKAMRRKLFDDPGPG
jgi:hypothetical protein